MTSFSEFQEQIAKVKKMELPGEEYHLKMAPLERILELKQQAKRKNSAKRAGVLALFYPDATELTHFALILRNTYPGVHSAQVGFPGGRLEPDDPDLEFTALRETHEEVGVPKERIEVIRALTEIYIPPSNFLVSPFLGTTSTTPSFVLDPKEVVQLIEVPLQEFLMDSALTEQTLSTSYASRITVPAFHLQGHVVWGATAMMLNEIRELLRNLPRLR